MALHWFPFYPGDFIAGTIRLGFHERGAYALMLVAYYANGGPFPLDLTELYRMVGCESDADRRSIDRVLQRKFIRTDSGWIHERAEHVIAEQQTARARRIAAAQKRWSNAHAMHEQSMCNQNQNQNQNQNHKPEPEKPKSKPSRHTFEAEKRILAFLNETAGKRFRDTAVNLTFIKARLDEGITEEQLRKVVVRKCREWLPDDRMRDYLQPKTLFNRTNCENYVGNLVPSSEVKHEL